MAAITAISIEGFQSHVDSALNLCSGLNVITGPSDSGKTAVIRAVRWLAFNEPQGEAFVNEAIGEAIVKLTLDSGQMITKRRRKGKTSYLLQINEEDEGSLYEKSEVPEEVKSWLQIEKQHFGDFEAALNFSFQLDPPFLISETASAGAKVMGKLAGTESVDLAIKGISKDTYGARQERTNAEKDIERIAGSMLAYSHIDDAKEAVDLAEMLLEQIEASNTKCEGLKDNRNNYESLKNKLEKISVKLSSLEIVQLLEEILVSIEKAQKRYDLLLDLSGTYLAVKDRLQSIENQLQTYERVEEATELINALHDQNGKLNLFISLDKEYQKYTEVISKTSSILDKMAGLAFTAELVSVLETHDLNHLNDLKILELEYKNAVRRTETALERVTALEGVNGAEEILNATAEEFERLAELKELDFKFGSLRTRLKYAEMTLAEKENDLTAAQTEEAAAWDASGGICPLCELPHERGAC